MSSVAERFEEEPLIRATIDHTLGGAFLGLGEYERAQGHIARALELRRRELGSEHELTLDSWETHIRVLETLAQWGRAEEQARELIAVHTVRDGAKTPAVLRLRTLLGGILIRSGRLPEAEAEWLASLEVAEAIEDRGGVGALHQNLGDLSVGLGKLDRAEFHTRLAIEILSEEEGPEHSGVLRTQSNLGRLYVMQKRWEEARGQYLATIETQRRVLGPEHPDTLISMNSLSVVRLELGEVDDAIAQMKEVLALRRKVLEEQDPSLTSTIMNLGVTLQRQDDFVGAEPHLREALALRREHLGEHHHDTLRTWAYLAANEWGVGERIEALRVYRLAADGAREHLPETMWRRAWLVQRLAACLQNVEQLGEAEEAYSEAYESYCVALSPDHPRAQRVVQALVAMLEEQGRTEAAAKWREKQVATE